MDKMQIDRIQGIKVMEILMEEKDMEIILGNQIMINTTKNWE